MENREDEKKTYFRKLKENYGILNSLKTAVIISALILILDIKNIPSKIISEYIVKYGIKSVIVVLGAILFIAIIILIESKVIQLFKIRTVNIIDKINSIVFFSVIIYIVAKFLLKEQDLLSMERQFELLLKEQQYYLIKKLYKEIIVTVLGIATIIMIVIRYMQYNNFIKEDNKYKSNMIDLEKLYNGDIETGNKLYLLDETEVNYDLLGRDNIIDKLYNTIQDVNPREKCVISLEGKWGSGKTTIINNVINKIKKEDKIIVINEFDPWVYKGEKELLTNMFNTILKATGIKYNSLYIRKLSEDLSEIVLGENKKKILKSIFTQNDMNDMKNKINDYIKASGNKIVFFIDNIDRAEKENVILLFRLVASVLNFEKVVYVLSFDNKQVKKIFEKSLDLDYDYLKKVIQVNLYVPEIDENKLRDVYRKSLENLLNINGESEEVLKEYEYIINYIIERKLEIRDFKKFLNRISVAKFHKKSKLCKKDLLIIEYIRLFNYDLYLEIKNNKKYFIIHDLDKLKPDEEKKKQFFEELFSKTENNYYREIVHEIFPCEEIQTEEKGYSKFAKKIERKDSLKQIRICNGRYFDLYFTDNINDFAEISELAKQFINFVNEKDVSSNDDMLKTFLELEEVKKMELKVDFKKNEIKYGFFELLQVYMDDLNEDKKYNLIENLFSDIEEIPDVKSKTTRSLVGDIIKNLLNQIDCEQFKLFIKSIEKEYKKINIIKQMISNFKYILAEPEKKKNLEEMYNKMCKEIITENINLYDNKYYMPENIYFIYYNDCSPEEKRNYIRNIVTKENIFKFIYDLIRCNEVCNKNDNNSYKYIIYKEDFEYLTTEEIDNILEDVTPESEDEKFILKVYNNCKKYGNDEDYKRKRGIKLENERIFSL